MPSKSLQPENKEAARQQLLATAFDEIWNKGYNGTKVDEIIAKTNFTKGAFYYYFPSKKALAFAVLDEIIREMLKERWVAPFEGLDDPFEALVSQLNTFKCETPLIGLQNGCPLNNLAQELSATDEEMRIRVNDVFMEWIQAIAAIIQTSQKNGFVKQEVKPEDTAMFIIAGFEGCTSLAKATCDRIIYERTVDYLIHHLKSLQTH